MIKTIIRIGVVMIRIITRTFYQIAVLSAIQALRISFLALRILTPWVLRGIWFTMQIMFAALLSIFVGIPRTINIIAEEWLERAVQAGFPTQFDTMLFHIMQVAAFLTLLAGWVAIAIVTTGVILTVVDIVW